MKVISRSSNLTNHLFGPFDQFKWEKNKNTNRKKVKNMLKKSERSKVKYETCICLTVYISNDIAMRVSVLIS